MMPKMPPSVERVFAGIGERVRLRRSIRGIAIVVIVSLAAAAIIVLLDSLFNLPRVVRCGLFLAWLGLIAMAIRSFVRRPRDQSIETVQLAQTIESQYPNFSERLITLSQLENDPSHGSPLLISQLKKECEKRVHVVKPLETVSQRSAVHLAIVAGITVIVSLIALSFAPGGPKLAKRFIVPWSDGEPAPAFKAIVTSGEPTIRRGDPFTITAYLERIHANGEMPKTLPVTIRDESGKTQSIPMVGDDRGQFHAIWPKTQSPFQYQLNKFSDQKWHVVKVGDPVSLGEGTSTTIESPAYSRANFPTKKLPGFSPVELLQHGRVQWSFQFMQPYESATLEFQSASGVRENIPLPNATWQAKESGRITLTTTSQTGIRTVQTVDANVIVDMPPRFDRIVGITNQPLEIRPGERIPIEVGVSDDLSVMGMSLEYRIAEQSESKDIQSIAIPCRGMESRFADGKVMFDTKGLCATGQTLLVRLKVTDNRHVPESKLTPHVTYFPQAEWLPLRVTASAKSLAQQQIFGQRDRINDALRQSLTAQSSARQEIATVAGANVFQLSDNQLIKLQQSREQLTEAGKWLDKAKREAELIPELNPVAEEAKAIAAGPIQASDDLAKAASLDVESTSRRQKLQASFRSVVEAMERTEKLIGLNEQLAQRRLEQRLLNDLAREERDLIERLANAKSDADRDAIKAEQTALKERLAAAIRENPGLQKAAEDQAKTNAAERAKEIERLKAEAEELDKKRKQAENDALKSRNADFAKKQKALADEIAASTGANNNPSRAANGAADRFEKGDAIGAMADQESSARELDQYANGLERDAMARSDPKEMARQIALWQADYEKRFQTIVKSIAYPQLPDHAKKPLSEEAIAIAKAIEKISVPKAQAAMKEAAQSQAMTAVKSLETAENLTQLKRASAATKALADKLAMKQDRWKASKIEVSKLIDSQNDVAKELADAKAKPEKVKALAARQKAIAATIADLDTPGLEHRRDRLKTLADTIADDLDKSQATQAATTIPQVLRLLERLRQALDGIEPADDAIERLTRKQNELADQVEKLGPKSTPQELDDIKKLQREIGRDLASQSASDSQSLIRDAKEQVAKAEQAHRDQPKPDVDELKKKSRKAADAMNQLAERSAGAESDSERIERLKRNREQATEHAKKLDGQPLNLEASAAAKQAAQADLDELSQTRAGDDGLKAKAKEALNRLKNVGDPDRQKELQKQAAEALAALQQSMAKDDKSQAKGSRPAPPQPDFDKKTAPGLPTQDRVSDAKEMAAKQRAMRDQAAQAAAAGTGAAGESLKKTERDLSGQIAELAKQLQADAKVAGSQTADALSQASQASDRAVSQAERAIRERDAGRQDSANQARQQLKYELAQAGQSLKGIAPPPAASPQSIPGQPLNALQAMTRAEKELGDKNNAAAGEVMGQAIEWLTGQSGKGQQGDETKTPKQDPSKSSQSIPLPPDLKAYEGVAWGALPGEVKNRIVQELAAKYGEDYARSIKLYFEQLAEQK